MQQMQRAWSSHWNMQLNLKLLQLVSILAFSQSLEILGYDFESTLQKQKIAMSEVTKSETSHIKEEQVNQGGLTYSENSMSNLKYCMYRAAYTVTALKIIVGVMMQHTSTRKPKQFQRFTL